MSHVGEMVHINFRGQHMAALITSFYEDEDTARLTVFDQGGPSVHSRVLRGKDDSDDLTFHSFDDCSQLEFVAPEPWVSPDAPATKEDMTVPELKAALAALDQPVGGNKAELIARLEAAEEAVAEEEKDAEVEEEEAEAEASEEATEEEAEAEAEPEAEPEA